MAISAMLPQIPTTPNGIIYGWKSAQHSRLSCKSSLSDQSSAVRLAAYPAREFLIGWILLAPFLHRWGPHSYKGNIGSSLAFCFCFFPFPFLLLSLVLSPFPQIAAGGGSLLAESSYFSRLYATHALHTLVDGILPFVFTDSRRHNSGNSKSQGERYWWHRALYCSWT